MRKKIVYLTLLIFALIISRESYPQEVRNLKETFDFYVRSVQNENLEDLFSVVSDKPDFFFLTSHGKLIDSRDGYYKFHKGWFEEDNWEMPVELVSVNEGKEYGYANAIYHFKANLEDGRTYNLDSYFTLIFHKEDGIWKVIADVCTPINRYYSSDTTDLSYSAKQDYLFDIMNNRRTVRKYKNTPVPIEHIVKILDAARMCPTAGNQQPWKFLVVRDREKLNLLEKEASVWFIDQYQKNNKVDPEKLNEIRSSISKSISNALSAPAYVAVLVDKNARYSEYIVHDGALAAGYLMIAARSLGYGTGYFTSFFPGDKMKAFFDIPDNYQLICFTPIGVPEEWPETPEKKDLDDIIVWENF